MIRSLSRRITAFLLVPLLSLLLGCGTGGWHCADGALCELPAALVCCCGYAEGETVSDYPAPIRAGLSNAGCGCYYDGAEIQATVRNATLQIDHPLDLSPGPTVVLTPVRAAFVPPSPATESPPLLTVSPRAIRGPPNA